MSGLVLEREARRADGEAPAAGKIDDLERRAQRQQIDEAIAVLAKVSALTEFCQ